MEPVVDLGPGAGRNELARNFAELVRDNVRRDWQRAEFERLRGSIGVVVDDLGSALTLRFDFGRLTVHDGLVGVPDVTIRGRAADIRALQNLRFDPRFRLPTIGRESRRLLAAALRGRDLKIYGLVLHAGLVLRLLRILARTTDDPAVAAPEPKS